MRRSTTVRGGVAAAVILVLGLGGLAACSGNGDTPPVPSGGPSASAQPTADTVADEAALASITVTGDAGAKPTIALPSTPFAVTSQVARLVDDGTGDAVADGDLVAVRNSRFPDGAVLLFNRDELGAFLAGAKDGEFDDLAS